MKKVFWATLLVVLFGGSVAIADTTIGKCRFYGNQPSSGMSSGTMRIYHSGDLRRTGSSGNVSIWEGTGSVWVIFRNAKDVAQNQFRINGNLQTCNDF